MSLTKKIWVLMGLNDTEFQTRMTAVTTKLRRVQSQSIRDARRLSITTQEMFYGMTVPLGLFGKTVFDATKKVEQLHISLSTIAKSKGITDIEGLIKSTTLLAKLPGLGLEETFSGVRNLIAVGFGAKAATRAVEGLGIGIARAGGSAETFGRVMTQITQGLSLGKLMMQDFRTVFEQLPEARPILERAFGPGMSDIENLRKAGISVREVVDTLVDGFHELGAQGFMDTMANKLENVTDSWLLFRAAIGEKIFKDQIHGVLDAISSGLEKAAKASDSMSPGMISLIQTTSKWLGIIAIGLPAITYLGKMFYLLRAQAIGLALGIARINPYVLVLSASLIAIEQIGKRLIPSWQGLTNELKLMGRQIVALMATKFPSFMAKLTGIFGKKADPILGPPGTRGGLGFLKDYGKEIDSVIPKMDDLGDKAKELAKELEGLADAHEEVLKIGFNKDRTQFTDNLPLADSYKNAIRPLEYFKGKIDKVTESFMRFNDKKAGLLMPEGYDPLPNISTADQARFLFANDDNVKSLDAIVPKFTALKNAMNEIFAGPIADGVVGVADAFGVFVDTALKGAPDAFGAMAKAMGSAVKSMIVELVKLIAKLAIAAALWSIFGGGIAGATKGLGGLFNFLEGRGKGFLGSLLKGITGFSGGGIAGGSSKYGDKILARVNSGELMLNERQQKAAYSQMSSGGTVRINGELFVRGRNLVYVLEETQVQLKSAR